jgi:hypothetical protein
VFPFSAVGTNERYRNSSGIFYTPAQWVPHITLGYKDVTPANLDCVMQNLVFEAYNWDIQVDNLIQISQGQERLLEPVGYRFGA